MVLSNNSNEPGGFSQLYEVILENKYTYNKKYFYDK